MRKIKRSKEDERWLEAIGAHIQKLILEKGYKSPYDFWVQQVGDEVSRAALNYVLKGRVDVKATTLRKLALALGVEPKEIFNFKLR